MKSTKYLNGLLQNVFEKLGMSEESETIIKELKDSIEERDNHLKNFAENWDNDADEFEFKPIEGNKPDSSEWQSKYNELKGRYIDRFFNGDPKQANVTQGTDTQFNEDTNIEGSEMEVEDLFVEVS